MYQRNVSTNALSGNISVLIYMLTNLLNIKSVSEMNLLGLENIVPRAT